MKTAGYPFMIFAGDGLNSSPGVQLQQGVDNRVSVVSVDTVNFSIFVGASTQHAIFFASASTYFL
jgi:hypothetical protein